MHARPQPGLLWRSIVQGFRFAICFFLLVLIAWIVLAILGALLIHGASQIVPVLPANPIPSP